jgi:hypothetical protein
LHLEIVVGLEEVNMFIKHIAYISIIMSHGFFPRESKVLQHLIAYDAHLQYFDHVEKWENKVRIG